MLTKHFRKRLEVSADVLTATYMLGCIYKRDELKEEGRTWMHQCMTYGNMVTTYLIICTK